MGAALVYARIASGQGGDRLKDGFLQTVRHSKSTVERQGSRPF
jgi:hypothetical protein